jgi:hypothetical protein
VRNVALADPNLAGSVEYTPKVAVAGHVVTLKVTFNDPELLGSAPAVPYETVRAGDVQHGVVRATDERGIFAGEFVPREPGRRWISFYFPTESGRTAASASFVVYPPDAVPAKPSASPRLMVLRPEPGPAGDLPSWLEPATFAAVAALLGAEALAIAWVLRRTARAAALPVPAAPAVPPASRPRDTRRRGRTGTPGTTSTKGTAGTVESSRALAR